MNILIVGGGIAGLSAAIALQGDGHDITIAETLDGWKPTGAGLHLPGNAVTALRDLGIDQDVADKSCAFPRLDYFDHRDRKLFALETKQLGWPTFQALTRSDFHEILCAKLTTPTIRFGLSVSDISNAPDQAQVRFTDGTTGSFDLVIGADGINSAVRRLVFGPEHVPQPTGYICWRWITDYPFGLTAPKFIIGHGQVILVMPVGDSRFYIYASTYDPGERIHDLPTSELAAHFARFDGSVRDMLGTIGTDTVIHEGRLQQMVMPEWVAGRVALIGDAAHGTLPTMAQGATQSIKDSLALANAFRAQSDITTALADWQAARLPEAHWVQQQSLQRMGFAKIRGKTGVWLRNTLMRRIGSKIVASGFRPLIDGMAGNRKD
ncbi:2-polyprenyl-6-methoxyphenol hydroxylase-like FAD-dependent oxidoreductase [Thalassospira sp. MBR-102]|uniref:FAD-dependent monooxygenase n=1 Tax=Thalassospira sp. MBR-102 TaxID=3156466 RepID=UPI003395EB60